MLGTIGKQLLQIFLKVGFVMELVVPAFHPIGAGVGDIFSGIAPLNLVAFILHVLNKALPVWTVQQCVLNGFEEGKLPALAAFDSMVFSRQRAFFSAFCDSSPAPAVRMPCKFHR